jgi:hypothetical protein
MLARDGSAFFWKVVEWFAGGVFEDLVGDNRLAQ